MDRERRERRGSDAPHRTAEPADRDYGRGAYRPEDDSQARGTSYRRPASADYRRGSEQRVYDRGADQSRRTESGTYRRGTASTRRPGPEPVRRGTSASRRPVARKAQKRQGGGPLSSALLLLPMLLWKGLCALVRLPVRGFRWLNRKLDAFRRGEVSTVIVNSLMAAAGIVIVLLILLGLKDQIRMMRAGWLTSSGNYEAAQQLIDSAEKDGYAAGKLLAARCEVVDGLIVDARYDEALNLLAELPSDADTQLLTQRANYGKADALYAAGDYSGASRIFYVLNDYQDGAQRYTDCYCALAVQAWQRGEEDTARQLLMNLEGADARIAGVVSQLTQNETEAQALLSGDLFNAQKLAEMEARTAGLTALRQTLPKGKIAAGALHSVGLRADGSVLAAGDNSFGQINVGEWRSVTQLAAGTLHTVALCADGTVLATGNNSYGQCDVSGWSGIVQIAASAYNTLGLKADGTVVSCGYSENAELAEWHGVTSLAAGGHTAACLYDRGNMRATHTGAQLNADALPVQVSVYDGSAVGVLSDGSLVTTLENPPAWTDVAAVTLTSTGLAAIDGNGALLSSFFRVQDDPGLSVSGRAVEVESGGTHWLVLTDDGRVYGFGQNDFGQCDVSAWQLS